MKTKKLFAVLLLMLVAFSANVMMAQQMPPIPVDEAVRIGKLDNGLTYYIRHNDYPEHKVNFYIAQRVGAMQEDDNQQGLAHFLEHMAFNGSEHFPGNGIIDFTRSLGLNFGEDLNAGTGFTQTVYNIDNVPSTRQSALDSCLLILKDWSHGLLLTDKDINEERGVIHQEWRQTTDATERMDTRQMANIFPGSKYGKRQIIGLMDIVDNFPCDVLRNYYHKWYRPDNQALVIVGDVDVDYMEAKIQEMFKDIPAAAADAPQVELYPVPDNEQPIFVVDKDKETPVNLIYVMFKHDNIDRADKVNLDYLILQYVNQIISSMMCERFMDQAQEPECPYYHAIGADMPFMWTNSKDAFTMRAYPKDGQVEATLQYLITECRRAIEHGFTPTEYVRAQEKFMSSIEKQYNERNKVANEVYAEQYYDNFLENEPIPSIEQYYQIISMIAPNITVDNINGYLAQLVDMSGRNLVVVNYNTEKDGDVYPTSESLKTAFETALKAPIEAFVDNVNDEPLMTELPKPGKIVKERVNEQFGYKELELSNGARVILKKTDFKDNEIMMSALQRGGSSLYDKKDYENLALYNYILGSSGLGNFSVTDLNKALAGKQVSLQSGIDNYFDYMNGHSTVKDLETLFQLTYLKFTNVTKDEKSYAKFLTALESDLKNKELVPENVMNDTLQYAFNNYTWRSKPFGVENLKQVNIDRILQIAKERTANAAGYTFYFVGAFDEATIRPLIEQYIASLPAKKGQKTNWVNIDTHPTGQKTIRFDRQMETPKTTIQTVWYDTTMPYTMENEIKGDMLSMILDKVYTQMIREDAGAAYTVQALGFATINGDRPLNIIQATCPVKPEFTEETLKIMNDQMTKACNSIDASSIEDFKNELIKDYYTNLKENRYWMSILKAYVERGIDMCTGYEDIVKAQTPETISAFARQLVKNGNKLEVIMTPQN